MNIYFVRHGSTDSLENNIAQADGEPLNERGLRQASEIANRFKGVPIDTVISSPLTRAMETAQKIKPEVVPCDLFREFTKLTEIVGVPHQDDHFREVMNKINEMYINDPKWHYSDEENFEDLKKRGLAALEFLKSRTEENIIVVSHGNFLSLLVGLMLFGESYSAEIALKVRRFFRISNTGVSIVTYEEDKWKLQCWNDTSHCLE